MADAQRGVAGMNPRVQTSGDPQAIQRAQIEQANRIEDQEREQEHVARQQEAASRQQAILDRQEEARKVRAAAAAGAETETDIETGRPSIARHDDGAVKFKAGPVGQPVAEAVKTETQYSDPDTPGRTFSPFMPVGDGGAAAANTGEMKIAKTWHQRYRDDRGNTVSLPVETKTDPKTAEQYFEKPDAYGRQERVITGTDPKAAELLKLDQEAAKIDLRDNALSRERLAFEPRWQPVKAEFLAAESERKAIVPIERQEDGTWIRTSESGKVEYLEPMEVAKHFQRKDQVEARFKQAQTAYEPERARNEYLTKAERAAKMQRLELAARKISIEKGIPLDDGGASKILASAETGLPDPNVEAAQAVANAPASEAPKPPEDIDSFKAAFSGLQSPETIQHQATGYGMTSLLRDGRQIARVDARKGTPVVILDEADDLRAQAAVGELGGVPVYLRDGRRQSVEEEATWVANLFAAAAAPTADPMIPGDGATGVTGLPSGSASFDREAAIREMDGTPTQVVEKVKRGELSMQFGEAIMQGLYGSTLKVDDPSDPETFKRYINSSYKRNAMWHNALKAGKKDEQDKIRGEFVSEWYQQNRGMPGVTWEMQQRARGIVAERSMADHASDVIHKGADLVTELGGSMGGLLAKYPAMGILAVRQLWDPHADAALDEMQEVTGRANKNFSRGLESTRKKWLTADGKQRLTNLERANASLKAAIAAQDVRGGNSEGFKSAMRTALAEVTEMNYQLHAMGLEDGWEVTRDDFDPNKDKALGSALAAFIETGDPAMWEAFKRRQLLDKGNRQAEMQMAETTEGMSGLAAAFASGVYATDAEAVIEIASDLLTLGTSKLVTATGKATQLAAKGAETSAAMGRIARTQRYFNRLGQEAANFGKVVDTLARPASKTGRAINKAVDIGKVAAVSSVTEGIEEGVAGLAEPGATPVSVAQQAGIGALAGVFLTPVFTLPMDAANASRATYERKKQVSDFASWYNRTNASTEGFKALTPADAEAALAMLDPLHHQQLLDAYTASTSELAAAQEEMAGAELPARGSAKVSTDAELNAGSLDALADAAGVQSAWKENAASRLSTAVAKHIEARDALSGNVLRVIEAAQSTKGMEAPERTRTLGLMKAATGRGELMTAAERNAVGGLQTREGAPYFADVNGATVFTAEGRAEVLADSPLIGSLIQSDESRALVEAAAAAPPPSAAQPAPGAAPQPAAPVAPATAAPSVATPSVSPAPAPPAPSADATSPPAPAVNAVRQPVTPQQTAIARHIAADVRREVEKVIPGIAGKVAIDLAPGSFVSGGAKLDLDSGTVALIVPDIANEVAIKGNAKQVRDELVQTVLRHEVVHVVQAEALRRIHTKNRESRPFAQFFGDWYAEMWAELPPEAITAARTAYGEESWDAIANDGLRAAELVRMLVEQAITGEQATDLQKALHGRAPQGLLEQIQRAIAVLREMIKARKLPESVRDHITQLTELYDALKSQPEAPVAPQKGPVPETPEITPPEPANPVATTKAEAYQPEQPEWAEFPPESGSLGIPRAAMPQIKAEDRSALVQFLRARDIDYEQQTVPADSLKATQAEWSPEKVAKARAYQGGSRRILVSSDGHVVDGHHQWMADLQDGKEIDIIRLDAPIRELLAIIPEMPSVEGGKASRRFTLAVPANVAMFRDDPVIAEIRARGGIMSKSKAKEIHDAEWWRLNKSLYDDAPRLGPSFNGFVYDTETGLNPDVMAMDLPGIDGDVGRMWEAIQSAHDTAVRVHREGTVEDAAAEQGEDFLDSISPEEGRDPIALSDLEEGDRLDIDGEMVKVMKVERDEDGYVSAAVLQDGRRFGRQRLEGDQVIYVEEVIKTQKQVEPEAIFAAPSRIKAPEGTPSIHLADGRTFSGPALFSVTAYHGTPHKVDKFTTAKIGTGEGAQAFGWGLYFAAEKTVAEGYAKRLSGPSYLNDKHWKLGEDAIAQAMREGATGQHIISRANEILTDRALKIGAAYPGDVQDHYTAANNLREIYKGGGNLYTVRIKPAEDTFLDWDKRISDQPAAVREALRSFGDFEGDLTSREWYREQSNSWAVTTAVDPETLSKKLLAAGIRGIRFLDGNSRGTGNHSVRGAGNFYSVSDGNGQKVAEFDNYAAAKEEADRRDAGLSRNFVVFSDNDIEITAENGRPVVAEEALNSPPESPSSLFSAPSYDPIVVREKADAAEDEVAGATLPARRKIGNVWLMIAARHDSHQLGKVLTSKEVPGLVEQLPAGFEGITATKGKIKGFGGKDTDYWEISAPAGNSYIIEDAATVWVNTSTTGGIGTYKTPQNRPKAGAGPLVYQIAMAYARNNGKTFVPDPDGVSDLARPRRWSHMLSGATRFRDTSFFGRQPGSYFEVPGWSYGNDVPADIGTLALAEMEYVRQWFPEIDSLQIGPDQRIVPRDGISGNHAPGTLDDLLSGGRHPGVTGIGEKTLLRAIVTGMAQGGLPLGSGRLDSSILEGDREPVLGGDPGRAANPPAPGGGRRSVSGERDHLSGLLYSAPSEADALKTATLEALRTVSPLYREVFAATIRREPAADTAKRLSISETAVTNILNQVRGRIRSIVAAQSEEVLAPAMRDGKIVPGRPDLALSTIPEVAAVDQVRTSEGVPDVESQAEVTARAEQMLAADYEGTYDGLITRARDDGHFSTVEVAAAKLIIARESLAGRSTTTAQRIKLATLIHGYRDVGTETARSLAMRRDPYKTPAERHASYFSEALLSPDARTRAAVRKAGSAAARDAIFHQWAAKTEGLRQRLLQHGIDVDASLAELQSRLDARKQIEERASAAHRGLVDSLRQEAETSAAEVTEAKRRADSAEAEAKALREQLDAITSDPVAKDYATPEQIEELRTQMRELEDAKERASAKAADLRKKLRTAQSRLNQARELDPATVLKLNLKSLPPNHRAAIETILTGGTPESAAMVGIMSVAELKDVYTRFRKSINDAGIRAAKLAKETQLAPAALAAAPSAIDYADMVGVPSWDAIEERSSPTAPRKPRRKSAPPAVGKPDISIDDYAGRPPDTTRTLYEQELGPLGRPVPDPSKPADTTRTGPQAEIPGMRGKPVEVQGEFAGELDAIDRQLFPWRYGESIKPGTIDLTDPLAVKDALNLISIEKGDEFDALTEFWRMSILSGPQTHIVNVASNTLHAIYDALPRRAVEAGVNGLLGVVGQGSPESATFGEFAPMAKHFYRALQLGGRNMLKSWKLEQRVFEDYATAAAKQFDLPGFKGEYIPPALGGRLGAIMRTISFRAMTAADEFMKSFLGQIEAAAQSHRIAKTEGLSGDAYEKRFDELMKPGSVAWIRSIDEAERVTFQSPMDKDNPRFIANLDRLAEGLKAARRAKFGGKLLTFFIPFIDTPTNIAKIALEMSPVGALLSVIDGARALKLKLSTGKLSRAEADELAEQLYNRARFVRDLTNQLIAMGVFWGLKGLVESDDDDESGLPRITGTAPYTQTRRGERDAMFRTMPPQSIRLGNATFSYQRVEPFATLLSSTVDLIRELKLSGGMNEQFAAQYAGRIKDGIKDKTFLAGVSNLINALEDPDRFATNLTANIVTGFVPNLIRQPLRESDTVVRDTTPRADAGFFEALATKVGYGIVPQAAPARIDVWGNPVSSRRGSAIGGTTATDTLFRILDPTNATFGAAVDPVDRYILNFNLSTADPKDRIAVEPIDDTLRATKNGKPVKIQLTKKEQEDANRRAGQAARKALGDSWDWRNPTAQGADRIKKTIQEHQNRERDRLRAAKIATAK
jgi:hypothetical protein